MPNDKIKFNEPLPVRIFNRTTKKTNTADTRAVKISGINTNVLKPVKI